MVNTPKFPIFTEDESHVYSTFFEAYVKMGQEKKLFDVIARYNDKDKIQLEKGVVLKPTRKFLKVGTGLVSNISSVFSCISTYNY